MPSKKSKSHTMKGKEPPSEDKMTEKTAETRD